MCDRPSSSETTMTVRPKFVAALILAAALALFSGLAHPSQEATAPDGKKMVVMTREEADSWSAARAMLENENEELQAQVRRLKQLAHEGCLQS